MSDSVEERIDPSTRISRLLADVAAWKPEPVKQRIALIDGLQAIFQAKLAWFYALDGWSPSLEPSLTHQVISSDAQQDWLHYMADFAVKNPPLADPWADHSYHCADRRQQWTRRMVLNDPNTNPKYEACVEMIGILGIGDGMICAYRPDDHPERLVGFALHRDEAAPWYNESELALARFACDEIAGLEKRGHLLLRPQTKPELPPRLDQVLDRLLCGHSPKQIAAELNLSLHTVREHMGRLYKSYGVDTREELTAKFLR